MEIARPHALEGTDPQYERRKQLNFPLAIFVAVSCSLTLKTEYFLVALFIYSMITAGLSGHGRVRRALQSVDRGVLIACGVMVLVWIYGVSLGLLLGWPAGWVVRNFAGLAMFLPFLLVAALVAYRQSLWRTMALAGFLSLGLLISLRLLSIFGYLDQAKLSMLGIPLGVSEYGLRLYTFGVFPIFALEAVIVKSLFDHVAGRNALKVFITAAGLFFVLAFVWMITESKGFYLGLVAILFLPVLFSRCSVSHIRYFLIIALVIGANTYMWRLPVYQILVSPVGVKINQDFTLITTENKSRIDITADNINPSGSPTTAEDAHPSDLPKDSLFDHNSLGNSERYEQYAKLLNEMSLFGKGFGAPLSSGYVRSQKFPYGFELSFVNIVHKLGAISVFYFSFLLYTAFLIWRSNVLLADRYVCMAILAYLFPSIGNPIILAMECVFLHALVLYVVTRDSHPNGLIEEPV